MTAHAMKGDEDKCLASGMDDFIAKPIRRDRLLKAMAKWVRNRDAEVFGSTEISMAEKESDAYLSDSPMDFATAVEEFGDVQIVLQVAGQLLDNARQQVGVMRSALHEDDAGCLQREAHAIKGGAWTIEARPLGDLAEKIEHLSRDNDLRQIKPLMEQFETELVRLQDFLSKNQGTADGNPSNI
jgi:HPt (histidine-containing phosphotransfer) domain-containing protein